MYLLTNLSSDPPQLRVDLEDWEGNTTFDKYDQFSVGAEDSDYTLSVSGYQSVSTAGDSLTHHNGQRFSTPDRDNDVGSSHCALNYHGRTLVALRSLCQPPDWQVLHKWGTKEFTTFWNQLEFMDTYLFLSLYSLVYNYSLRVAEMKIRPGGV